jgi:hypothetical protein
MKVAVLHYSDPTVVQYRGKSFLEKYSLYSNTVKVGRIKLP